MSSPYVALAGEHERLEWLGGGIMEVLLDAEHTGGHLSLFRSTVPTATAAPVHVHPDEDEIFVMLRGSGLIWAGDRRFELHAGGVAFLPRAVPHAYRFTSDDVDMLAIATPSGMEGFLRDAGWDLSRPKPAGWAVTPEALRRSAAANGQVVLGPPLAADEMIPAALLDTQR
ncbi:cupin domain-containing protein [Streptomyces sp. TS71-3]|uniref:cupin domain-containing protein n=1 Tax=Streptomyces sp. TS71-3 TaxID=2733862 RepID=UPI001B19B5FE|nr:cupin domain-containing protein [Streptomyces sp. TS71-3]GHJ35592.1 cupin [Streptomyces sp. TS71-3]